MPRRSSWRWRSVRLSLTFAPLFAAAGLGCNEAVTGPRPELVLSTANVVFEAPANAATPIASTVMVTNGGVGSLSDLNANVTYGQGQPTGWLTAVLSGTTAPITLTLAANASGLSPGAYAASVSITSEHAENGPQTVAVSFIVTTPPAIAASETSVAFEGIAGNGSVPAQVVEVTNSGGGSLTNLSASIAYAEGERAGWLSTSLSGTTAPSTLTLSASAASLGAGSYSATVALAASGASNTPQLISVTFVVDAAPAIVLSASNADFQATAGGSTPEPVTVSVTNGGGGTLTGLTTTVSYGGGQPAGWLTRALSTSTAPSTLTLTASPAALGAGTYTATVLVSATGGVSSQAVAVTLTVAAPPSIALSAGSAEFQTIAGSGNPPAQTVNVTNAGGGTLSGLTTAVEYASGQPVGWLTASLSGSLAPSTLTLSAAVGSLAPGTYSATATVASGTAANTPQAVAVTFVVGEAAEISLSHSTIAFEGVIGSPVDAQVVEVTNSGGGSLTNLSASIAYAEGETAGWLSTSLSGTTAPSTLTLSASAASLGAGSYSATVALAASGASNTPQLISVTFVVDAEPAIVLSPHPDSLYFYAWETGAPGGHALSVTNGGGGTLTDLAASIEYGAGATGWLSATFDVTTAPSTLTLSTSRGSLSPGFYRATVTVSSPATGASSQSVGVGFTIYEDGIFVSVGDPAAVDDSECGGGPPLLGYHPCRTIGQGLARAASTGSAGVIVADGVYSEAVTLLDGKRVLGGYDPTTWTRHLSTTNTIISGVSSAGNHDRTIVAIDITSPTVLEGFVIRGPINAKPGGNSYAIYVSNSTSSLEIRHNVIYGGRGGPGVSGSAGGFGVSVNGAGRDPAAPGPYDALIATGSGFCDTSNNRIYANGGVSTAGVDVISGGNGGGNLCSPLYDTQTSRNGAAGQPGAGASGGGGGLAGAAGYDMRLESSGTLCFVPTGGKSIHGADGGNGLPGLVAAAVAGGTRGVGVVVAGHWSGPPGIAGIAGGNGGGGGGGGAGGGAECTSCTENKDRLGGHGGGGGSGGGGGAGGGAGGAGGGAFAIFVVGGAAPIISDNTIVMGEGGIGGNGGSGGAGAAGGLGGDGGLSSGLFCTGDGGDGGDGGNGGHGSGGGGGSGGASFGIYTTGIGTPAYCELGTGNAISGGAGGQGGAGGASLGNYGGDGQSGAVEACSFN